MVWSGTDHHVLAADINAGHIAWGSHLGDVVGGVKGSRAVAYRLRRIYAV